MDRSGCATNGCGRRQAYNPARLQVEVDTVTSYNAQSTRIGLGNLLCCPERPLTNQGISRGAADTANPEQCHQACSVRHAQSFSDFAHHCRRLGSYGDRVSYSAWHRLAQENQWIIAPCNDWHRLLGKAHVVRNPSHRSRTDVSSETPLVCFESDDSHLCRSPARCCRGNTRGNPCSPCEE